VVDGMTIEPGDLVVGDDDGVIAVPFAAAAEVYGAAMDKHRLEEQQLAAARSGTLDRSWVDLSLQRLGCEVEK
jgi:regulator of RNase E activity RraA